MKSAWATVTLTDCAPSGLSGLLLFPLCTFPSSTIGSESQAQVLCKKLHSGHFRAPFFGYGETCWPVITELFQSPTDPSVRPQTPEQPQPNKIWEILFVKQSLPLTLSDDFPTYTHKCTHTRNSLFGVCANMQSFKNFFRNQLVYWFVKYQQEVICLERQKSISILYYFVHPDICVPASVQLICQCLSINQLVKLVCSFGCSLFLWFYYICFVFIILSLILLYFFKYIVFKNIYFYCF